MRYYLRLIGLHIRASIQEETAFRLNFMVNILSTILNLTTGIVGIYVLFSVITTLQGWTFQQTLTLFGIYQLIIALQSLVIQPSMNSLGGMDGDIWSGRFDYTLIKPVQLQFLVSIRRWQMWAIIDVILSLIILGIALSMLGAQVNPLQLALFLLTLVLALSIVYSIFLVLASTSLWYQGIPLVWIFTSFMQMSRYPVSIYPDALRLLLTWVIPVAFITTVPVQVLTGPFNPLLLFGGLMLAVVLFVLATLFFKLSLRRYTGASS